MSIHYAETYEINDESSAESGEALESGFVDEELESDFRHMVDLLQGTEPSQYPLDDNASHVWFTNYGEMDYTTGEYENHSYHPKTDRDCRYMIKAWKMQNNYL